MSDSPSFFEKLKAESRKLKAEIRNQKTNPTMTQDQISALALSAACHVTQLALGQFQRLAREVENSDLTPKQAAARYNTILRELNTRFAAITR